MNETSTNNQKKSIKVSIIMPVYNVDKYIRKCLDSIVNQTLTEFEVICINDGSTDKSLEILNEYAAKDDRFVILSQENQGQGVAKNNGIEIARGEYIQFIDPDDWVDLNMLEVLYDFAKKNDSKVVKFSYYNYNDYSGELKEFNFAKTVKENYDYDLIKTPYYSWKILKNDCLIKLDLHVWAHFYLTSFVKSNNICFAPSKHGEDHLFVNAAIILSDKIDFVNKSLYFYRNRKDSAVNIKSDNNFCVFDNIRLLKEFIIHNSLYEELKDEMKKYSQNVLGCHYGLIPEDSINKYEDLCRQYFDTEKDFKKFIKKQKTKRKFIENIFSLKNESRNAIKYKAVTIFGFTFLIKPKKKEIKA